MGGLEPDPPPSTSQSEFVLWSPAMAANATEFEVFKYDKTTGESWRLSNEFDWDRIVESPPSAPTPPPVAGEATNR